jgi:hypothetical protein
MVRLVPPVLGAVYDALPPPAAEPHAASATVRAAAAVSVSHLRLPVLRMLVKAFLLAPQGTGAPRGTGAPQGPRSKHLENISNVLVILESGMRPVNP